MSVTLRKGFSTDEIETMTRHYVVAALWSSTDENGEPLDAEHDASDVHADTLAMMEGDCESFAEFVGTLTNGMSPEQAGHDFWLTRNGHGAGFWDRGLGVRGRKLTDAAHSFGSVDLYVGDDGMIHGS